MFCLCLKMAPTSWQQCAMCENGLVAGARQSAAELYAPYQVVAGHEQVECRGESISDCCAIYVSKRDSSLSGCLQINFLSRLPSFFCFKFVHSKTHYACFQWRRSDRLHRRSAQSCRAYSQHTSKVSRCALTRSISEMLGSSAEQNPSNPLVKS